MSAPDTNVRAEARRHRPALFAIGAALLVVTALLFFYLGYVFAAGQEPGNAEVKIDGRTGEEVIIAE